VTRPLETPPPMREEGPVRVKLSRAKGWRMPPNTVKVDRTTVWGNPFQVGQRVQVEKGGPIGVCFTASQAVEAYRGFCEHSVGKTFRQKIAEHLRGKNLACWCALDASCHADVLLELANFPAPETRP